MHIHRFRPLWAVSQADTGTEGGGAGEGDKKPDAEVNKPDPKADEAAAELAKLKKERDELLSFKSKAEAEAEKTKREKLDEAERLKLEREDARKEALAARREAVALKYNLPDALAARLQGETREELEADAKALAELLPKGEPAKPANTGTPAGKDPDPKNADAVSAKKAEIAETLKKGDPHSMLAVLKLKRELAKLEAAAK